MPLARIPLAVLLLVCVASSARGATTTSAEDCYFDVTEDQVSVSAANFVAVEGCYTESPEYESFDRTIYTNDGGAVTNGTTIAILGSEDPTGVISGPVWAIGVAYLDQSGDVYVEEFLCVGSDDWSMSTKPWFVESWKCDADGDAVFSDEEVATLTCGCSGAASTGSTPSPVVGSTKAPAGTPGSAAPTSSTVGGVVTPAPMVAGGRTSAPSSTGRGIDLMTSGPTSTPTAVPPHIPTSVPTDSPSVVRTTDPISTTTAPSKAESTSDSGGGGDRGLPVSSDLTPSPAEPTMATTPGPSEAPTAGPSAAPTVFVFVNGASRQFPGSSIVSILGNVLLPILVLFALV